MAAHSKLWYDFIEEDLEDMFMFQHGSLLEILTIVVSMHNTPIARDPSIKQQRCDWDEFLAAYRHSKQRDRHLRMPLKDFEELVEILTPQLDVDEQQSLRRGLSPIIPTIKVYCCIRWLAGGSYSDICLFAKISWPSFYRVCWETIGAINQADELQMKFPETFEECMEAANAFRSKSFGDAINNCVSAIDGYCAEIYAPPKEIVGNVRSYFSGHYQKNCVNIQAACDANCKFQYFAVAGPGNISDRKALEVCELGKLIRRLPGNFVAIGDAAYPPLVHLCPLYYGADKTNKFCDNFNYFGSQLRIRIEMAFGMMQQKWGILWRPLRIGIERVKHLLQAVARLHNYCVTKRLETKGIEDCDAHAKAHHRFVPSQEEREIQLAEEAFETAMMDAVHTVCTFRTNMAQRVQDLGLSRPKK